MLLKTGKGTFSKKIWKTYKQRKFRFPVALHLDKAVGALTLHTGVGTIEYHWALKNANGKSWRTVSPCQNEEHCKDAGLF